MLFSYRLIDTSCIFLPHEPVVFDIVHDFNEEYSDQRVCQLKKDPFPSEEGLDDTQDTDMQDEEPGHPILNY